MTVKLLYLVANQDMTESRAKFVATVTRRMGAELLILFAAKNQDVLDNAEASYSVAESEFQGITYQARFVHGDPVEAMEAELALDQYELLLFAVGRRKRVIPSQFRMLSQQVIKKSPIPVLLVRQASEELDKMLVCTGGMEVSERVVLLSTKLAGQTGMEATLMTVSPPVPSMYTGMAEMEETMEELLETDTPLAQHLRDSAEVLSKSGIPAEVKVIHGEVVEGILEETGTGDYDLVVLGDSESWTLRGLLLGNVTQQIINRATCAVLVVK